MKFTTEITQHYSFIPYFSAQISTVDYLEPPASAVIFRTLQANSRIKIQIRPRLSAFTESFFMVQTTTLSEFQTA